MNTLDKIKIMQAFVDGKEIELMATHGGWVMLAPNPKWNWDVYSYRIKLQPKIIYVNEYGDDMDAVHYSEQEAKEDSGCGAIRVAVKYKEVIW